MREKCAWCGKGQPQEETVNKRRTTTVCLQCIDKALRKIGQVAEHESWLAAFELERQFPAADIEMVDDKQEHAQ